MPSVGVCPKNRTETYTASERLNCGNDEYGTNQYMCVSNKEKSSLIEFCYKGVMELENSGSCLEVSEGKLNRYNCSGFSHGCPDAPFHYENAYEYPACQYINTHDHCYVSDPSCPTQNLTEQLSSYYTSTDIYTPTDFTEEINSSTVPIFVSTTQAPMKMSLVIGLSVSAIFLVLVCLVLNIKRYRKRYTGVYRRKVREKGSLNTDHIKKQSTDQNEDNGAQQQSLEEIQSDDDYNNGRNTHEADDKEEDDDDHKDGSDTSKAEDKEGDVDDHKDGRDTTKAEGNNCHRETEHNRKEDTGAQWHNTEDKERDNDDDKDGRDTSKAKEDAGAHRLNTEDKERDGEYKDGRRTRKAEEYTGAQWPNTEDKERDGDDIDGRDTSKAEDKERDDDDIDGRDTSKAEDKERDDDDGIDGRDTSKAEENSDWRRNGHDTKGLVKHEESFHTFDGTKSEVYFRGIRQQNQAVHSFDGRNSTVAFGGNNTFTQSGYTPNTRGSTQQTNRTHTFDGLRSTVSFSCLRESTNSNTAGYNPQRDLNRSQGYMQQGSATHMFDGNVSIVSFQGKHDSHPLKRNSQSTEGLQ